MLKQKGLSPGCITVIELLNREGFEAYAVGGCVRDLLMGKIPKDFDVATSASPNETMEVFKDFRVIPTGLRFGTVSVIIEGEIIEITTFRTEGEYTDNRRPDSVDFVSSIEEDLSRRDFTINAMAYNPETGVTDPFGGKEDIKNGLIRAVGDPEKRFSEDALRILRAYRFMARYHFRLEEETKKVILEKLDTVNNVARERILKEITEIFESGEDIYNLDFIPVLFPDVGECFRMYQNNRYHYQSVGDHTYQSFNNIENRFHLKMTMLLHDIGKLKTKTTDENGQDHFYTHPEVSAEMARIILQDLKVDSANRERIITLIRYHDWYVPAKRKNIKRALRKMGEDVFFDMIKVWIADDSAKTRELVVRNLDYYRATEDLARKIVEEKEPFTLSDLKVNGYDMIDLGLKGAEIGKMLERLLARVIEDPELNDRDVLLSIAIKKIDEK